MKPNPLNNCTIKASLNQSSEILEVECVPGYDGGLRQEFRLEAYEVATGNLRVNASSVSADVPIFRIAVADLLPATHFYVVTYAVNAKGRSDVSLLEDIMLRDSEKHTGNSMYEVLSRSSALLGTIGESRGVESETPGTQVRCIKYSSRWLGGSLIILSNSL